MNGSSAPTSLHIHTLQSFCDELISGRAVLIGDSGKKFYLTSPQTRSLLQWYVCNPHKWTKHVLKSDLESLVNQLQKTPAQFSKKDYRHKETTHKHKINLKSIKAHRFAGIHEYGSIDCAPEDFYFDFQKPITLIHGKNGAGKTSLLNAITWCLTGYIYRSNRPPEPINLSKSIEILEHNQNSASDDKDTSNIPPITPLPSAEVLKLLKGKPIPVDTWVELTFINENGEEIGPIRRSLERTSQGKIQITEPHISFLGLDPISSDIGTRMPGMIPYIQETISDFGLAVAQLTGLKPLFDLVKHAGKSQLRFERDLIPSIRKEIKEIDTKFAETYDELQKLLKNNPQIDPCLPWIISNPEEMIEKSLEYYIQHFKKLRIQTLSLIQSILGKTFNPETQDINQSIIIKEARQAIGLLDMKNLARIPSFVRLYNLTKLNNEQLTAAEQLIKKLITQAKELSQIAEQPETARRLRLYAHITNWIKENLPNTLPLENCPVCHCSLKDKIDEVTGEKIETHIQQNLETEISHLETTFKKWQKNAISFLASELPEALYLEINKELPPKPSFLIQAALSEELFENEIFNGTLAPLKQIIEALCHRTLKKLPPFLEPEAQTLPSNLDATKLNQVLRRVSRAISFARWRQENAAQCKKSFCEIIGHDKQITTTLNITHSTIETFPLLHRLLALDQMSKECIILTKGLEITQQLCDILSKRREKEQHIARYKKTKEALNGLIPMNKIVREEIATLMKKLDPKTAQWKTRLYASLSKEEAEKLYTTLESDGSLIIRTKIHGSIVSSYQVSNSSDLIATLLSFLLAFRDHILDSRGGLSLLLFDNLQDYFDEINRERIAKTLPTILLKQNRQLIITTNDTNFYNQLADSSIRLLGPNSVDCKCIEPLKTNQKPLQLKTLG
jgi:hypothetical protein